MRAGGRLVYSILSTSAMSPRVSVPHQVVDLLEDDVELRALLGLGGGLGSGRRLLRGEREGDEEENGAHTVGSIAGGRLYYMRHGETVDHFLSALAAKSAGSRVWHAAQALGTFRVSVSVGVMNLNVWARTLMSAMVCSIFGMWQFDALVAGAAGAVMGVRLDGGRVRTVGRIGPVALQAQHVRGLHAGRRCFPCRGRRGN